MKSRTVIETAIICTAVVAGLWVVEGVTHDSGILTVLAIAGVAALGIVLGYRYLTSRKRVMIELAGSEQYRKLAEEFRRLTDMAITAQEHTDLKLAEVTTQLDFLREQNDSMHKILKDVE